MVCSTGTFNLVALPNATSGNTFEFTIPSRAGTCNSFLSCTGCGSDVVDIYGTVSPSPAISTAEHERPAAACKPRLLLQDDGSGRQQFTLTSVPGGYTIQVLNGRTGCNDYVVAQSCATGTGITFAPANDGTGLAVWELAAPPPPPPTTQYFANGVYEIVSTLRATGCNTTAALGPDTCATNNVFMQAAGKAPRAVPCTNGSLQALTRLTRPAVCSKLVARLPAQRAQPQHLRRRQHGQERHLQLILELRELPPGT